MFGSSHMFTATLVNNIIMCQFCSFFLIIFLILRHKEQKFQSRCILLNCCHSFFLTSMLFLCNHRSPVTYKVPLLTSLGMLLISLLTIFWCSCFILKGSTVKGRVPVSMANMLTPLQHTCKNVRQHIHQLSRRMDSLNHLHGPDVHFGPVLPVSQKLRGGVGRTSTLGAEELQRQRVSPQSVAQAKVCGIHYHFYRRFRYSTLRYSSINSSNIWYHYSTQRAN